MPVGVFEIALIGAVVSGAGVILNTKEGTLLALEVVEGQKAYRVFERAPQGLKGDREVVLKAIRRAGIYAPETLGCASAALKANKRIVLAAVEAAGGCAWQALENASEVPRADKEVVLAAVVKAGRALQYASEALRADKEVVLAAVAKDGDALEYASDALKADKELVLAAMAQRGWVPTEGSTSFYVTGFSRAELNVVYEPRGEFGGMPLYRGVGGSEAGMYWREETSKWLLNAKHKEEYAEKGMANGSVATGGVKAVPLGERAAKCWDGEEWQEQTVTLTATTAEGRAQLEKAFKTELKQLHPAAPFLPGLVAKPTAEEGVPPQGAEPEPEPEPDYELLFRVREAEQQRSQTEERMRELELERQALEEQLRLAQQEPEPEPEPERNFASSNFKREYEKAGIVPITKAAQIIGKIPEFVHTYCHVHGRASEADAALAEAFVARLQDGAGQHPEGGGGDLTAAVRHTAELLWTSQSSFRGMGDHDKEFCSLLNASIRDDQDALAAPAAMLSRGLNALCAEGRSGAVLPFPPGGDTYRGGGFGDDHRDFFTEGKQFRVPGFLATSFSRQMAERFRREKEPFGPTVLWVVHVDPAGEGDHTKRCKHVNFVAHSLTPGEQEYLFTAYSIFTVRSVTWGAGGAPHRIELDAASDNRAEAEGGEGRWATPAGSERLPLAPWY